VVARTLPGKQFEVGRDLRARIIQAFSRQGVAVQSPPAVGSATPGVPGPDGTTPDGTAPEGTAPAGGAAREGNR
jgi:hypothetical protein